MEGEIDLLSCKSPADPKQSDDATGQGGRPPAPPTGTVLRPLDFRQGVTVSGQPFGKPGSTGGTVFLMSHRILVVDDDTAILDSLKSFLHDQLGFDVKTAEQGQEAVDAAMDAPFDLCILDVNLPDLSGSEVYLRLRSIHPDIEAVFYTGVNDFEKSNDFLRFALPPERVLAKPANLRQLTQVIMSALGPPRD